MPAPTDPYEKAFILMSSSRRDSERYRIYSQAVDRMEADGDMSLEDRESVFKEADQEWYNVLSSR